MIEVNVSEEFRLKNIEEIKNYLIEEIKENELIGKNHKKVCKTSNHIVHLLILASSVTGRVSISAFTSLVGIPAGITSVINKCKLIIEKKKKEET